MTPSPETVAVWSFLCINCKYGREYHKEWEVEAAAQNHRDDYKQHTTIIHAGSLTDLTTRQNVTRLNRQGENKCQKD